ncbi:putative secretory pathway GDP dissociation inhibitor 1 [Dictyocoela muelleri]|nr:putative secretory pathway GDP dissociation inhibitor 1 [Dictyocoela muelleri]
MEEYDFIILGTGLVESVLSANLSLKNKKILHIDKNSSYGAEIRSCNYQELLKIYSRLNDLNKNSTNVDKETLINNKYNIINDDHDLIKDNHDLNQNLKPIDELINLNNQFSVDITPKLLLSNGYLQNLLDKYDINDYITFVLIPNSFIYTKKCYPVPTTELNCLESPLISFWQKPKLIQFMWDVKKFGDLSAAENNSIRKRNKERIIFKETMKQQFEYFKLNTEIQDLIGHAIALNLNDDYLNEHPRVTYEKICLYVSSINSNKGVNSPYVYPLYGLSELAQTFCRKSAVHGTIFRLGTPVLSIQGNGYFEELGDKFKNDDKINDNANLNCQENNTPVIQSESKTDDKNFIIEFFDPIESITRKVKSKYLICDPSYVKSLTKPIYSIIRCTCLIKGKPEILPNKDASQIIFLNSFFNRKNDIFVLILSEKEKACPENYYVALISTVIETDSPKDEIEFVISKLGNVIQRFYRIDHVYEYFSKVNGLFVSKSVDHTTHLESVLKNIDEIWKEIKNELKMS